MILPKYWHLILALSICYNSLRAMEPKTDFSRDQQAGVNHELMNTACPKLVDVEQDPQDFILELKHIVLPDYKEAFNPSIVRWEGRLLMSFRILLDLESTWSSPSALGLVWLDDALDPVDHPQILKEEISLDDCRLISSQNRLFIIFNRWVPEAWSLGQKMYIGELTYNDDLFSLHNLRRLFMDTYEENPRIEKNWVPFDYEGKLLLSYSLEPHLVFLPNLETGSCTEAFLTKSSVDWPWGELRGGTPALLNGSHYLAFFHSCQNMASNQSSGVSLDHYFMGAYLFSNKSPFELVYISPRPIVAKGFYSGPAYKPYWGKEVRVVFPAGFISDDDFVWLVYGRQDRECWAVKLDKKKLLNSLVPVNSLES